MEFSFDRGPKSPKSTTSSPNASDPYSDARSQHLKNTNAANSSLQAAQASTGSSPDSAEDRLKKAIERNRAKQEMRSNQEPKPTQTAGWSPGQVFNKQPEAKAAPSSQPQSSPRVQPQANTWSPGQVFNKQPDEQIKPEPRLAQSPPAQPGLFQAQDTQKELPKRPEIARPEVLNREGQKPLSQRLAEAQKESFNRVNTNATAGARVNVRPTSANSEIADTEVLEKKIPTSRSVVPRERRVTVEEEFTTPVKKVPKKISPPAYVTKKNNSLDPRWQIYLIRGAWAFCILMLVRLFFSQGGVADYFEQSRTLGDKKLELEQIRSENMAFTKEISRMMNDVGYQKKIVRDNLGFIAQDEFLILFPKE